MSLSTRLDKAEEYGLPRDAFPLQYRGHRLLVLVNDAYDTEDGRVLMHVSLICPKCDTTGTIRGRTPYGEETPNRLAIAKLAVFGPFTSGCTG